MKIVLDKQSRQPVYRQIVEQVRAQIFSGELPAGTRLPPERRLAESLGVNRTTVLGAYRELKADGLIDSRVGSGTVVAGAESDPNPAQEVRPPIWEYLFSEYAGRMEASPVSEALRFANRSDMISFSAGVSGPGQQPAAALEELRHIVEHDADTLLVSPVEGFYSLRQAVSDYMARRGCFTRAEEIMMLSGSQQGIDLIARVLLNPGDIVVMEEPTFFPAVNTFRAAGARIMGVPMTQSGMDLEVLEQLLRRWSPKLIYTMPSFHNPCGTTMPVNRRVRLLELACQSRTVLLEDDAYGELAYDAAPLPTLKSMDQSGFVVYLNTFSKTVYPGLRLGWMAASPKLIGKAALSRQHVDLHANCLSQQMIDRFLRSGGMDEHLLRITEEYRTRRDLMLTALERHAPEGMEWNAPAGGYYLWCRLPRGVDAQPLARLCAARGVAFLPGPVFYLAEGRGEDHIRLNYTFARREDIAKGIQILCEAVREQMDHVPHQEAQIELNPIL